MTTKIHTTSNPGNIFNPQPFGFSHVAQVPANAKIIYIAGQGGESDTQGTLSNDFRTQVACALQNLRTALQSAGADLQHIAKLTTLVVDHSQEKLQIIIEEWKKAWPDELYPVNTLIPVPRLALDGMLVEIDATAVVTA
ncbi:enamine deaminase RidA (YjgF/YER057c/UK114 family) [Chitinophaga skermanii]|uniref:Enamine deaminase RidA (YjgF/YER057c/UK114 family) n=1 Tax=Chitinophaga skermanii TaxID=331697 RepID=A0A327Q9I0_9BACT|nr:RidA family protein [Chitinophaga skermanii]RAJ00352.1 enamine deaminase RidA (YjgF/YER057c/UK114 family) [Chitinophaga skermanii]